MGLVALCCTMTECPAQNSGIDSSLYISPGAKMCGQGCRCRVFWGAFTSPSDFPGGKKSMAGRAGASILVSLAQALEFLFKVEERPAKGLHSWQGSDQKEWVVFL